MLKPYYFTQRENYFHEVLFLVSIGRFMGPASLVMEKNITIDYLTFVTSL